MLSPDSLGSLLLREHRALASAFAELLDTCRADSQEAVAEEWSGFEAKLEAHFSLEEAQILPAFAEVDAARSRRLITEHQALRDKLGELGVAVDLHSVRMSTVEAFVAELSAHAEREEALLYRWVDQGLSSVAKAQLRASLLERRGLTATSVIFDEGHEPAERVLGEVAGLANLHSYQSAADRFDGLRRDVERHLRDEEEVILPSFLEHTGDQATADAIRAEHARLRDLAGQLSQALTSPDHPGLNDQLHAFEREFREHCGIDERVLTTSLHEALPSAAAWHDFIRQHRPRPVMPLRGA